MATDTSVLTPARPTGTRTLGQLALLADGAVCAALGAALLAGAGPAADFAGLPVAVPVGLGLALLPYGVGLFLRARRGHDQRLLPTIATFNALWVVASAAIILAGRPALTTGGTWAVGLLALAVADIAAVQFYAARRAR